MSSPDTAEAIIQDAFEDVALLIGGAAVLHQMEDGVLRTLLRRLERVRGRLLSQFARVHGAGVREPAMACPCHTHPAVERFLRRNRHSRLSDQKEVARVE